MAVEKFLSFEEMELLARKAGDWIFDGNYLIGDYKGREKSAILSQNRERSCVEILSWIE
jgi:hypothetical protein